MSDDTRDLLVRGIAAAKGNSKREAEFYLEWVARSEDAERDEIKQAWRWLAAITDDAQAKRERLEQALAYDPSDPQARRDLAILNGDLKPEDIIDPDRLVPCTGDSPPGQPPVAVAARRFVCTQCGGLLEFEPDRATLSCQYCKHHESLADMGSNLAIQEQGMAAVLATARGHSRPVATQLLCCQGCGASFVLSPQTLSTLCPYCGSPYVVERTETRDLIAPEGVVPFAVSRDRAHNGVCQWYGENGYKVLSGDALPSGVYVPAWTFDLSGEIPWNCLVEVNDRWVTRTGAEVVYENDVRVAASHVLAASLAAEINEFPLDRLVPYDPRYVVDWPAETYQIAVSDASLVARARVFEKTRRQIENATGWSRDLRMSTAQLVVESFKLILVPLWISRYRRDGQWYTLVVNGQTGELRGDKPVKGVRKWLSGWID